MDRGKEGNAGWVVPSQAPIQLRVRAMLGPTGVVAKLKSTIWTSDELAFSRVNPPDAKRAIGEMLVWTLRAGPKHALPTHKSLATGVTDLVR